MKTRIKLFFVALVATGMWLSCQKMMERDTFGQDRFGNVEVGAFSSSSPCYDNTICTVTLPNDINGFTRTLHKDTVYLISGLTRVRNGGQLVIPAGTRLLGDANPMSKGFLVIEVTGTIQATGSDTCPIIFTSSAAINSRQPGDWGGVFILGEADNNGTSSSLQFTIGGTNFNAGDVGNGVDDDDDSGTFRYVQIHYAGYQPGGDTDPGALLFGAVGKETETHHIQISHSANDGFTLRGGITKLDYVFNFNVQNRDFVITNGNRSEMQFIAAMRKGGPAPASASGYGFDISSSKTSVLTSTPYTHPVISNATILGPGYCSGSLDDYEDAVRFFNNGSGSIFNSVFAGYPNGLHLDGDDVVGNTSSMTNELQFSYNSFYSVGTPGYSFSATDDWDIVNGCELDMDTWLEGGSLGCHESENQLPVGSFSMNESVCNNYCATFPTFTLGTNSLLEAVFGGWATGFDPVEYRGAFDETGSWIVDSWMDLCPQQTAFCL